MKDHIYIYLAGNIRKGKEDDHELFWGEQERTQLQALCNPITIEFLNPASRSDDLSDQMSVFGRDLFQVFSSDLVYVDLRGKRGLGVGAELMFAKMNRIPVVGWLPNNSHYDRKDMELLGQFIPHWIHPFAYNLCDCIAPNLAEGARWIKEELHNTHIKGPKDIQDCLRYYLETQLPQDIAMRDIVAHHSHFIDKLAALTP